jgi:hypothetical protein
MYWMCTPKTPKMFQKENKRIVSKVKLNQCDQIGRIVPRGQFCFKYRSNQKCWAIFYHWKFYVIKFIKILEVHILGDFFSQHHFVTLGLKKEQDHHWFRFKIIFTKLTYLSNRRCHHVPSKQGDQISL